MLVADRSADQLLELVADRSADQLLAIRWGTTELR